MPITTLDDGSAGLEFLVKSTVGFAKGLFLGYLTSSFIVNKYHIGSYTFSDNKKLHCYNNSALNGIVSVIATDILEYLADSSVNFEDDAGTLMGGMLGYYIVYKHRKNLNEQEKE